MNCASLGLVGRFPSVTEAAAIEEERGGEELEDAESTECFMKSGDKRVRYG